MTYRIDGIPLDRPDLGWVFRSLSNPLPRLALSHADISIGTDGTLDGLPAWVSAPEIKLVVMSPRENLQALITLITQGTTLDDTERPGQSIHYELLEVSPIGYGSGGAITDVTFRIRYPRVYWRDNIDTTPAAVTLAATTTISVFPNLSAPVDDATIRVRGACTGLRITDSSGAWLAFPEVPAGQWLRIERGHASLTTTDTWSGGTDKSGQLDGGGPRGWFEITPNYTDPIERAGKLTITTATRTGAQIQVRGRGAYVV